MRCASSFHARLRESIVDLASDFESVILLFDNLDKGWPARQVEQHDIRTVHNLIETLNKMERELRREQIQFTYSLFLRSDVYDNLVANTADRGKFNVIRIDWSDPEQLEALIRERVISGVDQSKATAAWQAVNPPLSGRNAISVMIESSLMRPRFLIELCEKAISFAINRRHASMTAIDVEDALKQQSLYLVSDFGYEIRDVAGVTENIFYKFIGKGDMFTPEELIEIIGPTNGMAPERVVDLLVWYGFLGIPGADGKPLFIYDRLYDMRRLEADRTQQADNLPATRAADAFRPTVANRISAASIFVRKGFFPLGESHLANLRGLFSAGHGAIPSSERTLPCNQSSSAPSP
jgi:hypothetical protein